MAFAGSNHDYFATLSGTAVNIGGTLSNLVPTGARVYLNSKLDANGNAVPSSGSDGSWTWDTVPTGAKGCLSFRPELWELINGNLDSALMTFLTAAPGGPTSLLGLWHEASTNGPGGSYDSYFDSLNSNFPGQGTATQTPAQHLLTQAQHYVQTKASDWGANVKVGVIEVINSVSPGKDLAGWMEAGLDFYACDVYDYSTANADPTGMLSGFQGVCDQLTPGATIGVTETNSRFPGRRPWWFHQVWSWLQSNNFTGNSTCCLTYWNATGKESGDWIPGDWATIDALYAIFAASSP